MPTENRSSNTEMVSVPRDIIEFAVGFKTHGYKNRSEQQADQWHAQDKLRALLAQPAEQHQGERVGEVVAFGKGLHEIAWAAGRMPRLGTKLYTHPAPADPGEVERLRADLDECDGDRWKLRTERRRMDETLSACANERDTLRAQLAERDALLSEAWEYDIGTPLKRKIRAALSASAEPSAPQFETCKACHGECAIHTGIDEAPTTLCNRCDGSGNEPSAPVERDEDVLTETLRTCEKWFVKHSPTAPLIGGFGDAEHPMLTCIRAALERKP